MNLRVRMVQDVFDISSEFRASSKGGSFVTRGRREAHDETNAFGITHGPSRDDPPDRADRALRGEARDIERRDCRWCERHV